MVFVVRVKMLVFRCLVLVLVLVQFAEVQPDARAHEQRRNAEPQREAVAQKQNRKGRAYEWRDGKVSARPRRAQVAQRQDKQGQTQSVAAQTDDAHGQQNRRAGQLRAQRQP
jgi:hypothetical protein